LKRYSKNLINIANFEETIVPAAIVELIPTQDIIKSHDN